MKKVVIWVLAAILVLGLMHFVFSGMLKDREPEKRVSVDISNAKTISELTGATIAAQSNTFHKDALSQIDDITAMDYPDFTDLLNALRSGVVDGYVAEEPTALDICGRDDTLTFLPFINNETGFTATDEETGIAVAFKLDSELVEKVNEIIKTISPETRFQLMSQMVALGADTETEKNEAPVLVSENTDTSNGTLKIAMECAYAPFNWTQLKKTNGAVPIFGMDNMYANGYDVQIARYIAAELGMELEVHSEVWDSLIPAVKSGAVDGIIAGMSPTAERKEEVAFTDCYYNSNLVVIIRK